MTARRPLLLAAAAVLCVLAAVPGSLHGPGPASAEAPVVNAAPGGTTVLRVTYEGARRDVVLHVPDGLLAPAPLVVVLHEHSHGAQSIRTVSRFERLADQQGFVVAFPAGAGGSWNAGTCCYPASEKGTDDVAYLDQVLEIVRTHALIDPSRISFSGASNGGMMALRYACERPAVVASVAVVSGPFTATCTPAQPVAVLELYGALDGLVPLAGGPSESLRTTFPPVDESLEPFRQAGGEVDLRVVSTAGHGWMTLDGQGVDATRALWTWMRDHPKPL